MAYFAKGTVSTRTPMYQPGGLVHIERQRFVPLHRDERNPVDNCNFALSRNIVCEKISLADFLLIFPVRDFLQGHLGPLIFPFLYRSSPPSPPSSSPLS